MNRPGRRAIFLDRDGVLNRAVVRNGRPYPPASIAELDIPETVAPALQRAVRLGFVLIGATNQPDVARGTVSRASVELIHRRILEQLPLREMLVCWHDDRDRCDCRKPQPGLLQRAAAAYGIDLSASYMIGDRWRDVEAGRRAGCRSIWIDCGYREPWPVAAPECVVYSLQEAIELIAHLEQEPAHGPQAAHCPPRQNLC